MAGINRVILIGNLGKDPEIITFDNGVKKASFPLATTESYKNKEGNWVDQTEWHNIVLWGYLAERNLIKGEQIYIEGKIRSRSWEDKDGNKRYTTEIFGDKVLKLGKTSREAEIPPEIQSQIGSTSTANEPDIDIPEDDLPF
ncbi:MAG: single-stranded DNA-binding protein [Bacteroidales bacterium]|nr:single-stranded DNA-binding protein [Bacteroidales bacterium]